MPQWAAAAQTFCVSIQQAGRRMYTSVGMSRCTRTLQKQQRMQESCKRCKPVMSPSFRDKVRLRQTKLKALAFVSERRATSDIGS